MAGGEVTREALFEMVWSEPITTIARRFDVSDVAVIKACKKLQVPRPPRGYWARRKHGYAVVDKPRLPYPPDNLPLSHYFNPPEKPIAPIKLPDPSTVAMPAVSNRPHDILVELKATLSNARPDQYGRVGPTDRGINVSPKMLPRAVRVLSTLFRALEQRGHSVRREKDNLFLTVRGEEMKIAAYEVANRIKIGKPSDWGYQRWEYRSSGILTLKLRGVHAWQVRPQWSEGKTVQMEDRLPEIVVAIEHAPTVIRAHRDADELRNQRWRRARLEEQRAEDVHKFALKRAQAIEEMATRYDRALKIRALVAAIEQKQDAPVASRRLARWGALYADHIDPLVGRLIPQLATQDDEDDEDDYTDD